MKSFSREELLELAPAYAVGATSPEETAAMEAALAISPELAAEVASFREVAATIAQQQSMKPSPSVRSAFLDRVSESKNATIAVPISAAPVVKTPRWVPMAVAAALALAVGMGGWNFKLRNDVTSRDARIDSLNGQLATANASSEHRHEQLNTILEGEQSVFLVHMTNIDTTSGPGIQFFWNQKQHRGLLHAFRLKPAAPGRSYQLWLLVKGKPVSASVFNSDPDGHAIISDIQLPPTPEGVTDVLLTEEPAGGSPGPTSAPFVGGKMRAL